MLLHSATVTPLGGDKPIWVVLLQSLKTVRSVCPYLSVASNGLRVWQYSLLCLFVSLSSLCLIFPLSLALSLPHVCLHVVHWLPGSKHSGIPKRSPRFLLARSLLAEVCFLLQGCLTKPTMLDLPFLPLELRIWGSRHLSSPLPSMLQGCYGVAMSFWLARICWKCSCPWIQCPILLSALTCAPISSNESSFHPYFDSTRSVSLTRVKSLEAWREPYYMLGWLWWPILSIFIFLHCLDRDSSIRKSCPKLYLSRSLSSPFLSAPYRRDS